MSAASRSVGRTRLRATWSYQARSSSTATTVSYVAMALTPPRRLERGSGAAAARSAAAPTGGGLAGAAAEPHGGQQLDGVVVSRGAPCRCAGLAHRARQLERVAAASTAVFVRRHEFRIQPQRGARRLSG